MKQIKEFLEENDAWEKYLENFHNPETHSYKEPEICDVQSMWRLWSSHADEFISCAFVWNKTPEGHEFWNNLNSRWLLENQN